MKKTIIALALAAFSLNANAQSIDEGIKMYKYERYQSAEKILTPLAASNNAQANYYLGLSQLAEGKTAEAKATFAKFPEDVANMSGLARVAFAEKNPTQGMQIAQSVAGKAKKKDWEPYKYAADALTYSEGANYQQAIDWYKTALQKTDDADVHIALADAYLKTQGGGGEAMNNYEHVTAKDPKNSLAYSRMGAVWYNARNYESALSNYAKAKDADPTNPLPYRDLARAYELSGKYDLAKQNIEKYLELSDKSPNDEVTYADILYLSKDYSGAINKVNDLINSGNVQPRFYGILAYSQMETKDSVNALKNARIYFAKQPSDKIYPADYLNYAKIYMMNSIGDSANFYFNKAITSDTAKDKSDIYRKIAEGFKDSKDYAKSAEWYNRLITEYPQTQALDYFWAVVMYYYNQDYTHADEAAAKYEAKYPEQPSATYWHARVKAAQDQEAKTGAAVPFFKKWLDTVGANYDKKNDLKMAYEYMLLYYYNQNDKANEQAYMDKLSAVDPNDAMLKQIKEAEAKPKKAAAPATKKK